MARLEDLNLTDDPLPDYGWRSFLELDALVEQSLGFELDDDPVFSRFCWFGLRTWR
jgi:hypothetical protein